MRYFFRLLASLALAALFATGPRAMADDGDAGAVRHLMMATFDKPEAPLTVDPVTVSGSVAVAGWSQGDMGGRALLKKRGDNWVLTLCSGDALKEAKSLQQFGLSAEEADAMANAVVEAEAKLDPALAAKFSTFDGIVMMDEEGNHPHGAEGGTDHKS